MKLWDTLWNKYKNFLNLEEFQNQHVRNILKPLARQGGILLASCRHQQQLSVTNVVVFTVVYRINKTYTTRQ